ncbi:Fe-S-binding ATPase [Aquaspirillum sp. LM1]|uniref:iron-sulfur cluster carrier protein ApbC n=1 Tax=Aquaspirillum sp. LM1 TaxID=1938604 RepID=UPI000983E4B8|nr:iron-sulfur cluster carrier protein ApbC [Aquaspirillum sp. LM1]AQR65159.1 Fe-S-binding ATPase [Aquaspirillum sp. LM1]
MNLIKTLFGGGNAALTPEQVTEHLTTCLDPNTGKDLVSAKAIKNLKIDGGRVSLDVVLGYPARSQWDALAAQVRAHLLTLAGVTDAEVKASSQIVAHAAQRGVSLLPGVKNIIAIASGKGGVGKSTTTVNLALALAAEGARVGILDADIYGPSQPLLLGLQGKRPESPDNKSLLPLESLGLQSMSIGYLVDDDQAMIWRGPMVSQALQQLLNDTRWDNLDYLLIDMPPGTGDVQLTLSQKIPVTGAVIVTTPQDIALLDAKKGLKMFEKVGVPILGLVENMSVHICSNCGHAEPIFGEGGAAKMAEQYGVAVLGQLPLDLSIRLAADQGKPTVAADPDGAIAQRYQAIARQVAIRVAERARDFSSRIPKIVIQNS